MSTKTVTAVLTANVAGFTGAMAKASASAKSFGDGFSKSVSKNEQSLNGIARGAGLLGVALAAGVGVAVKKFADFDSAMSNVAATGADAKTNIDALTETAMKLGASSVFSAKEAAEGIENLMKAGVSAADVLGGGLKGALDLAAAGELSVGEAAELAATAMTVFNLKGDQVGHVADLLAAGAGKAQGSVHDMGGALNQSALVAKTYGLSIEETTGSLALFAKAGLVGSDAGTSFKTALTRLYAASGSGAAKLKELGISAYDGAQAMLPFADVAQQLKDKLGPLDDATRNLALSTIFGSDAIRVGSILFEQGAAGVTRMTNEVNDFGYASRQAAERLNNLNGDLEGLSGAFDSAMISLGKGAGGPLRTAVQGVTGLVNAFNGLSDNAKGGVLAVAGIAAAGALAAAGIIKIVIAANAAKGAMVALGITAKGLSLAAGAVGIAITVAASAFVAFAGKQAAAKIEVDSLSDALTRSNGVIDENIAQMRAKSLEESGALQSAQLLGISIKDLTQASLGNVDAQDRVNAKLNTYAEVAGGLSPELDRATAGQNGVAEAARNVQDAIGGGNEKLNAAVAEYQRVKDATDAANPALTATGAAAQVVAVQSVNAATGMATLADGTTRLATGSEQAAAAQSAIATSLGLAKAAMAGTEGAANLSADALDRLTASMFANANQALALSGSNIAVTNAVAAAKAAFKENGKAISENTTAGAANKTALNNLAQTQLTYIGGLIKAKKSTHEITGATKDARAEFVAVATKMTGSSKTANKLADSYGLIPKKVHTDVKESGAAAAKARSDAFKKSLDKLPPNVKSTVLSAFKDGGIRAARAALAGINGDTATTYVVTQYVNAGRKAAGKGFTPASGGLIRPGGLVKRRAEGGPVFGAGSATSDSIPAMLSNGEFVLRAAAVRAIGVAEAFRLNELGGPQRAYATGGEAGSRSVQASTFTSSRAFASQAAPIIDASALRAAFNGVTVQVENPWTGEYHAARMKTIAGTAVGQLVGQFGRGNA